MDTTAQKALRSTGTKEDPLSFPHGKLPDVMWAFMELTELVAYLLGNPFPHLTWAYVLRKPASKKAYQIKEDYIQGELKQAVQRLSEGGAEKPSSAVDYIVSREKAMSEKEGRKPDFFSRMIVDEVRDASGYMHSFSKDPMMADRDYKLSGFRNRLYWP